MSVGRRPEDGQPQGKVFLASLLNRLGRPQSSLPGGPAAFGVLGLLLVVVVGLGTLWSVLSRPKEPPFEERLQAALEALDQGDFQTARRMAEELRVADVGPDLLGGPVFIQGATLRHEAEDQSNPKEKQKLYLIASRYLEEARDRGWPEGRAAQGWLYLAESLVHAGRYAESIPALQQALQANPSQSTFLHRLFAEAYAHAHPPQYAEAIQHIEQYLSDGQLRPTDRLAGQVLLARLHLLSGDLERASQIMERLQDEIYGGDDLPGALSKWERAQRAAVRRDARILAARVLVQQAEQTTPPDQSRYQKAYELLLLLQQKGTETAESDYLLAKVYGGLGQAEKQREHLARVARKFYGTPEGRAAAVDLAEIYQQSGQHDEAVDLILTAFQEKRVPGEVADEVLDPQQLTQRLLRLYERSMEAGQYQAAYRLTFALADLVPKTQALQLRAASAHAWGEAMLRQAAGNYSQAAQTYQQAVQKFQEAGELYEELARLRFADRHYPDDLWSAAEAYFHGRIYPKAATVLERYLREEPRQRRPRALLLLGECLLAMGNVAEAQRYFEQCYAAYRRDPDAYRARFRTAQALLEQGAMQDAERVLNEILESESLTPEAAEWRDALFLLGEVLHRQGVMQLVQSRETRDAARTLQDDASYKKAEQALEQATVFFDQAIARLTEAVQRYPSDPRSLLARYWKAEDYRHRSLLPAWQLPRETIQSRRSELSRRVRVNLQSALQEYESLVKELEMQQDSRPLTPIEKSVLRNAYFGRADALFELGELPRAIEAYSSASNRYQDDPVCLEAYQQIAVCYRLLGDPVKARGTLEQARIISNTLPSDVDYTRTTRYSRQVWLDELKAKSK